MQRIGVVLAAVVAVLSSGVRAEMLVTPEEAALPSAGGSLTFRGVSRGPKIEVVEPKAGATVKSPLPLKMTFQSFGGTTVSADSVKVTYVKNPAVDLTSRVKKYTSTAGVDMPTAELPPGEHEFRVELRDSEGRVGMTSVKVKVQ